MSLERYLDLMKECVCLSDFLVLVCSLNKKFCFLMFLLGIVKFLIPRCVYFVYQC